MAEDEQQKSDGRLLKKLLEGSSPRTPTYVLATITCDFTARQGTTELSVRRGDDVYVMFALRGWAFAAHMTPGSQRGYVPLGYCRAVEDFYESQMDTHELYGTQQREQSQAAHSKPQSFGEEALSTGLAAQECEIYPPPKEFQSSSSSRIASGETDSEETTRIPSTANFPENGRQTRGYTSAFVAQANVSHQRRLTEAIASAVSNSRTTVTDVTLAYSTHHNEPADCTGACTRRSDASQKQDLRALSQQRSSLLPLLPTCCPSQDESGIGDSNGSTSSSLDWCWEAQLSPEASTTASDDKCTDVSTGYAADSSRHSSSSNTSSSCSASTHEGVEICPCCLCPWPCTNTRLPTCECLCQGLTYYKHCEQDTAWQPALTSQRPTMGQVTAKAQMQSTHAYHYDKQCGDGAGGRLRLADGNLTGYKSAAAAAALVWGEEQQQQQQQQMLLLLRGAAWHRHACDEGYEEDEEGEDDVFALSGVQQHRRPPHSRSNGPSPRVTFNLLPSRLDHHPRPQASDSTRPLEGRQQKDALR